MKKILVLFVVALFVGTAIIAVAEDRGAAQVKYETKLGTVTFEHAAHQERTDCVTCHHSGTYDPCMSCHDGKNDKIPEKMRKVKDAYHKNCKECHKEKAPEVDGKKCKGCHVK